MKFDSRSPLSQLLSALFQPYKERVPDVKKVTEAMISHGIIDDEEEIVNDHIAFRTLGVPYLGIASFEKVFLHYGYTKMTPYLFEKKKLDAYWYAPPSDEYPRIFMSELRVQDLSEESRNIIESYTKDIKADPVDSLDLDDISAVVDFLYKPLWQLPTVADYQRLAEESEYAAWVIYNRYYLNHYTISVHELGEKYRELESFNTFLESIGIVLNTAGGKIKTSKDGLLKQSSSVAKMIDAEFAGGETLEISGSYVEFAERLPLPQFQDMDSDELTVEHRRDGFEAANADKIFESTYNDQTLSKG